MTSNTTMEASSLMVDNAAANITMTVGLDKIRQPESEKLNSETKISSVSSMSNHESGIGVSGVLSMDAAEEVDPSNKEPLVSTEKESSESNVAEDDVEVCDICGDAGREDMLAICSRCNDGAEHTYCMRIMLDKVPDGYWLCEGCQLMDDPGNKKSDKIETISVTGSLQSSIVAEKTQKSSHIALSKSDASVLGANANCVNEAEVTSLTTQHSDTSLDTVERSNPQKKPVISRESSSKNLEVGKLKSHSTPLSESCSAKISLPASNLIASAPSSPRAQSLPVRSVLSRSVTFNSIGSKPKVRQLLHEVPLRRKMIRESPMSRSLSFKTSILDSKANDSKSRMQSTNLSRTEESTSLRKDNGRNMLERKKSFKSERPLVRASHSLSSMNASTAMAELKPISGGNRNLKFAQLDTKLCVSSEPNMNVDAKMQSSVSKLDSLNNTSKCGEEKALQVGNSQSMELNNGDRKAKDIDVDSSKPSILIGGRTARSVKPKVFDHSSEFCSIGNPQVQIVKGSSIKDSSETLDRSNKFKNIVGGLSKAVQSNKKIHLSNDISCTSGDLNAETSKTKQGTKKMPCSLNDSCNTNTDLKDETCKNLTRSPSYPKKSTFLLEGKFHGHSTSDSAPPNESNPESYIGNQTNLFSMSYLAKSPAIPHPNYIWQGVFGVHRSGGVEFCDGVQAHLSTHASPKVLEVTMKFPYKIQLEEVHGLKSWPKQFQGTCVTEDDIALYFFAKDLQSYEKYYSKLLESMLRNDLALKGDVNGIQLLIYPSNQLPSKHQRWNSFFFLWGIFVESRSNCSRVRPSIGGTSTDMKNEIENFLTPICVDSVHPTTYSTPVEKDITVCDRSSKAPLDVKFNVSLDFSSSSEKMNHNCPKKSSLDLNSGICKVDSLEVESLAEQHSSSFTSQSNTFLDINSISGTQENGAELLVGSIVATSQKLHVDSASINCANHQTSLKEPRRLCNSCTDNEQPFSLNAVDIEAMKDRDVENSTKSEISSPRNQLEAVGCINPELMLNKKRPRSPSSDPISHPPKKLIETNKKVEENMDCVESEYQSTKRCCDDLPVFGDGFRHQNVNNGYSPPRELQMHFSDVEEKVSHVYGNLEDRKSAERPFFPVDPSALEFKSYASIPSPSSVEIIDLSESDMPNLELALGGKRKTQKSGILPFFNSMYSKNVHDKIIDLETDVNDDDDNDPMSLSLSLASPFSKRDQIESSVPQRGQMLPTEKNHVNTSLFLGGYPDSLRSRHG